MILFLTTLVGNYPQPDWLIDRAKLAVQFPPREIRRESYANRFVTALGGIDLDHHGSVINRSGVAIPVPRIVGPIRRRHAVEADDAKILRQRYS